MKKISIIVPVYNVEAFLSRCIDSILAQTFKDFDIILINDGSLDNSGNICDEYAKMDNRIRVIHKQNGGLSSARNAGLEITDSEYVFFIDSDDVIHPQTIELLSSYLTADTDIVICEFERFSKENELSFERIDNLKCAKIYEGGESCILQQYNTDGSAGQYVSACGKLFRKSLFENIRFPVGRLFEDEFTTYQLYYKVNKIVSYNYPLYYYFINDNGITKTLTLQKYFDEIDAQWERIMFYKQHNLTELYHKSLLHYLNSTRWNLISWRKKTEACDPEKGKLFDRQYRTVFQLAKKEKLLLFSEHYDYYVLGNPKFVFVYRLKRLFHRIISL